MQNAPNSLSKNLSVGQTEVLVHKQLFKMCISLQRGTQLFKIKIQIKLYCIYEYLSESDTYNNKNRLISGINKN